MEALAIIPARLGSRRCTRKVLRSIGPHDRPLIDYTLEAATRSRSVTRVVLTTESPQIVDVCRRSPHWTEYCTHVLRPMWLAGDFVPSTEAAVHAYETLRLRDGYEPDLVLLMLPTSPLRHEGHVDEIVAEGDELGVGSYGAVVSVIDRKQQARKIVEYDGINLIRPIDEHRLVFESNGALQLASAHAFHRERGFWHCHPVAPYVMSPEDGLDVDTEEDLKRAHELLCQRGEPEPEGEVATGPLKVDGPTFGQRSGLQWLGIK